MHFNYTLFPCTVDDYDYGYSPPPPRSPAPPFPSVVDVHVPSYNSTEPDGINLPFFSIWLLKAVFLLRF